MQGLVAGFVTAIGCFAGGYVKRFHPRTAYAGIGVAPHRRDADGSDTRLLIS
jgi:hypothetical protein